MCVTNLGSEVVQEEELFESSNGYSSHLVSTFHADPFLQFMFPFSERQSRPKLKVTVSRISYHRVFHSLANAFVE